MCFWNIPGPWMAPGHLAEKWGVAGQLWGPALLVPSCSSLGDTATSDPVDPGVTVAAVASDTKPGFGLVCKGDLPLAAQRAANFQPQSGQMDKGPGIRVKPGRVCVT